MKLITFKMNILTIFILLFTTPSFANEEADSVVNAVEQAIDNGEVHSSDKVARIAFGTTAVVATAMIAYGHEIPLGLAVGSGTIASGASAGFFLSTIAVVAAGGAGYFIGDIIVDADKVYFNGYGLSVVSDTFGPVFRIIHNAINEDQLPKITEIEQGVYKLN